MISLKKHSSQFNEIKRHFLPNEIARKGKISNGLEKKITKNELLCSAFSLLLWWLSDSFSFRFVKKPLFSKTIANFFVCWKLLYATFACLFIVVIYILIVLWIAKLHPGNLKNCTRKRFVVDGNMYVGRWKEEEI